MNLWISLHSFHMGCSMLAGWLAPDTVWHALKSMSDTDKSVSPLVATIASIVVPGLGYWLIGERKRAMIAGGAIILLFAMGIFIAGIRVISLPGYEDGYKKYVEGRMDANHRIVAVATTEPAVAVTKTGRTNEYGWPISLVQRLGADGKPYTVETLEPPIGPSEWVMLRSPMAQLGDNISFLGQMFNGPLCAVAGYLSNAAARAGVPKSYSRLADIGALYTAISGMLNLMLIVDVASRAGRTPRASRPSRSSSAPESGGPA